MTTCGQLLRKDLLSESADREQRLHRRSYRPDRISLVTQPQADAHKAGHIENTNGQTPVDPVIDEVHAYGSLDTKIATMAALHRIPGARAEVAMLSLSRAYVANCFKRDRKWTSGVHLAFWTLSRLDQEPELAPTDLREPIVLSVAHTNAIAKWTLIVFRLAFVADVAAYASHSGDPIARLEKLAVTAAAAARPTEPDKLIAWLQQKRRSWQGALSPARYAKLRDSLHDE
jgi:hypothetical protein